MPTSSLSTCAATNTNEHLALGQEQLQSASDHMIVVVGKLLLGTLDMQELGAHPAATRGQGRLRQAGRHACSVSNRQSLTASLRREFSAFSSCVVALTADDGALRLLSEACSLTTQIVSGGARDFR